MKVKLTKTWFTPDNRLLKPGVHDVPKDWALPKGTEEVSEEPEIEDEPAAKPVKGKASA